MPSAGCLGWHRRADGTRSVPATFPAAGTGGVPMSDRIPMTRAGYDKIKADLDYLQSVEMPKVLEGLAAARAEGDLSENAEYHGRRETQGMLEAKIRAIKDKLSPPCWSIPASFPKTRWLSAARLSSRTSISAIGRSSLSWRGRRGLRQRQDSRHQPAGPRFERQEGRRESGNHRAARQGAFRDSGDSPAGVGDRRFRPHRGELDYRLPSPGPQADSPLESGIQVLG